MGHGLKIALLMVIALAAMAEDLRISSSVSPLENVLRPISGLLFKKKEIRLVFKQASPEAALKDLEEGRADAAAAAMDLETWLGVVRAMNQTVPDPASLRVHALGQDAVQLITNAALPIVALRPEEVMGIFSGRIRNWKEVDGPDLEICLLETEDAPEIMRLLSSRLPKGESPAKAAGKTKNLAELRNKVAETSGAAAFGPKASNTMNVNGPIILVLPLPMVLVTKGEPSKPVKALLKLIASKEGRKLVMN